jgi:ferredoxin
MVKVDETKCVGCGLCEQQCPDVFKIADDGVAKVLKQTSDSCDMSDIASQCPVEAILVK